MERITKIFIIVFFVKFIFINVSIASNDNENKLVEIKILDKVSSINSKLTLEIGKEKKFENLLIKTLKCKNSEFDDYPEITAYIQVRDLNMSKNDQVFVFNGWFFSSSPSANTFDHPVYDIWLSKCY